MLHSMKESLETVIRSIHHPNAAAGLPGHGDDVAPEEWTVTFEMREHDVDGLTDILGRTPFRTTCFQTGSELVDRLVDILELLGGLQGLARGDRGIAPCVGLWSQPERGAQFREE